MDRSPLQKYKESIAVIGAIREAWNERKPVDAYVHQKMMQLVNLYLLVGGMPAAGSWRIGVDFINVELNIS